MRREGDDAQMKHDTQAMNRQSPTGEFKARGACCSRYVSAALHWRENSAISYSSS